MLPTNHVAPVSPEIRQSKTRQEFLSKASTNPPRMRVRLASIAASHVRQRTDSPWRAPRRLLRRRFAQVNGGNVRFRLFDSRLVVGFALHGFSVKTSVSATT